MCRTVARLFPVMLMAGCGLVGSGPDAPSALHDATVSSVDGVSIAYSVEGSEGLPVVLIHGWSCDRGFWANQSQALVDRYRVVKVDLAGHGSSGTDRVDWTVQSFGEDVRAVCDALGADSVILVGHSMGGPVALEAARLMAGRVRAVIGVDTLHNVELRFESEWDRILGKFERDFAGACSEFVVSMFPPDGDRELIGRVSAEMCDASPVIAVRLLRNMRGYDEAAALAAAGVPVRCINADMFPTSVESNRKFQPDFSAVILEGVGHFPMLERPDEFNRQLRRIVDEVVDQNP